MSSDKKIEQNEIYKMRHTAEHVLHTAMENVFGKKNIVRAMGPATETGFYFDFDSPKSFKVSENDFPKIEKEMQKLIDADLLMEQVIVSVPMAKSLFAGNEYKLDWIDGIEKAGEEVSLYLTGKKADVEADKKFLSDKAKGKKFGADDLKSDVDLCSGPHVKSTGQIKAFKLLSVAGAYWHGDENEKMLTRIYGTAFKSSKELRQYLFQIEEAKKRDHKKLGEKLDLFFLSSVAPGMPFWQAKGMVLRNILFERWKKIQEKYGYKEVMGPNMLSVDVFKQSGHWDHYKDDMFFAQGKGDREFAIRPMDCPGEIMIYKHKPRSYKDLPIKYSEIGTVTRNEKSGELNGLFRVSQMTQDDAHFFMMESQIKETIKEVVQIAEEIYAPFDFEYKVYLSTRPDDFLGDVKSWDNAEKILKEVMEELKLPVLIKEKDGAFYGPKLDYEVKDSLGRTWQCATIQLDFFMPKKFDLEYTGKDGQKHCPVMCHRAIMGSIERFIGILIEHYAGAFPVWLAPVQAVVLPIADRHADYAKKVTQELKKTGVRVELDSRNETLNSKIREAQGQKIPYMIVVGDREQESKQLNVRFRDKKQQESMKVEKFIAEIEKENEVLG